MPKFGDAVVKIEGLPTPYDPMTTRNQLHIDKLGDFTLWLMAHGWQYQITKGDYEVLRMTKTCVQGPLLVFRRELYGPGSTAQHLTLTGHSEKWFAKWKRSIRFKGTPQAVKETHV